MALNASGPISLGGSTSGQSINLELGLSATAAISLNDAAVRTLLGVSSGVITLNNAYGKSSGPQIAIDSTASRTAHDGVNGRTYTHTITSNTNGILVVFVGYVNPNGCTGVTYNGVSMTQVGAVDRADYVNAKMFVLTSPPTGANTISLNGSLGGYGAYSIAFTGANGYAATNSAQGANYTQPTMSLTTQYNNSYVVSGVAQADINPGNVISGMTQIASNGYAYSFTSGGAYRFAATAGSTTNAWTSGGDTNGWTMLGVEIRTL